jgi:hypothetical protein
LTTQAFLTAVAPHTYLWTAPGMMQRIAGTNLGNANTAVAAVHAVMIAIVLHTHL